MDDDQSEPALEQFNVTVTSSDPQVMFMPPVAIVTIQDDEGMPGNGICLSSKRHASH